MAGLLLQTESTLTDRYQTTIPDAVRKALHLEKRDKICYTVQSDGHVFLSKVGRVDNCSPPPTCRGLSAASRRS